MKKSKSTPDSSVIGVALGEAYARKKSSLIFICVYTGVYIAGYILWSQTKLSIFGIAEYTALIGYGILSIVCCFIGFLVYDKLYQAQAKEFNYYATFSEHNTMIILSLLGTALFMAALFFPVIVLLLLIESIEPLYNWLSFTTPGFLQCRGLQLGGCLIAGLIYLFFWIRYIRNKIRIPYLSRLYDDLREREEYWEEIKRQEREEARARREAERREQQLAAERRKAELRQDNTNKEVK